jgi:VWFA-related protein
MQVPTQGTMRAWFAIALSCALTAQAQDPKQPRYTERVDVSRVIVDARVVDHMGSPVRGLDAEDFRVRIGGKVARVDSVIWVDGSELESVAQPVEKERDNDASPVQVTTQIPAGRLIVFLFQKSLEPSRIVGLMRMLMEAQGFLGTLGPDDRIAVVSFDSHLRIWTDFTNDRERLRRLLEHGILFEDPPPVQEAVPVSLIARLPPGDARRVYSVEQSLQRIGEALEPLPGSKSVVLVGHGFGRFSATGVTMEHNYAPAQSALLSARASVFSLDVTNADYHSLEEGLRTVSEATGGFFVRTHLFPKQAMRQLAGALEGYYALFVEKPDLTRGSHDVKVQLTRRKGTVMARTKYES